MWREQKQIIYRFYVFVVYENHLCLFCNDLVPMRIDFLLLEAAIEKYSTEIGVEKFCYALHWSWPGVVVKTFENTSEEITKIMIFFKGIFQRF